MTLLNKGLPESILRANDGVAVALQRVRVEGRVRGNLAEIIATQHFSNQRPGGIEAIYTFPLPIGAVLLSVDLEIGGRHLQAHVIKRPLAERQYEEVITDGNTALMVEVSAAGLHTMNLGNLMPGESAVVSYRYALMLSWHGERVRLMLPTTLAPRYGQPEKTGLASHQVPETNLLNAYPFELCLTVEGHLAEGEIACPTHPVSTTRGDKQLQIRLAGNAMLDRDFVLLMKGSEESHALVFDAAGKDGNDGNDGSGEKVILAAFHVPLLPKSEELPLRLKVLIDCSGSMAGISIAQARKAALEILNQLRPGDYFNIALFGSKVEHFWNDLVPAEAGNITTAWKRLETLDATMGGSETAHALRSVLKQSGAAPNNSPGKTGNIRSILDKNKVEPGHDVPPQQILLITDGQVWDREAIVTAATASGHRIFTIGVGLSADAGLLSDVARETGGACEFVSPQEGIAERILVQFHRLRQPRMTIKGIKLGAKPAWFTPMTKSAFSGDTLQVFAGMTGEIPASVFMGVEDAQGRIVDVEAVVSMTAWADFPRMAAALRIAAPTTSDEDKLSLALQHQLLSEQTCLIVAAERSNPAALMPELSKVSHMLPAGWGGTGADVAHSAGGNLNRPNAATVNKKRSPADSAGIKSGRLGKYDIPEFLKKTPEDRSQQILSALFGSASMIATARPALANGHQEAMLRQTDALGDISTPQSFVANLTAGLEAFLDPKSIPSSIESLEDYGLSTEVANHLRDLFSEGWPERAVVAAFLMVLTTSAQVAGEFSRELSRLIFANWKRTGADLALLERLEGDLGALESGAWQCITPLPRQSRGIGFILQDTGSCAK